MIKKKPTILITGAAGYVGKTTVFLLKKQKIFKLVLVDKKKKPNLDFFKSQQYIKMDLNNNLEIKLKKINPDLIIHLAALTSVTDSEKFKKKYMKNNYNVTKIICNYCKKNKKKIIFCSSAAIYKPNIRAIKENDPKKPSNFYGKTKLLSENYIKNNLKKKSSFIILRFFNIAGGIKKKRISFSNNNFPVLKVITLAIKNKKKFLIYGTNPKNGKTAIRDYIHVIDVVRIIKKSIDHLLIKKENLIINCCTGIQTSIIDLINHFKKVTKKNLFYQITKKRKGEDFIFFGDNRILIKKFNFKFKFSIKKIVKDSYDTIK